MCTGGERREVSKGSSPKPALPASPQADSMQPPKTTPGWPPYIGPFLVCQDSVPQPCTPRSLVGRTAPVWPTGHRACSGKEVTSPGHVRPPKSWGVTALATPPQKKRHKNKRKKASHFTSCARRDLNHDSFPTHSCHATTVLALPLRTRAGGFERPEFTQQSPGA